MNSDLTYRSEFLLNIFQQFVELPWSILEIGQGDGRNVQYLTEYGYTNVRGIDKEEGTPIETFPEEQFDVIYSMSCFFLIPPENSWVFEKIARMAKKYIITIEGETTYEGAYNPDGGGVYGRDYSKVFEPYGFKQIAYKDKVFNEYGVLRILKRDE